jgi:hypothetical protein
VHCRTDIMVMPLTKGITLHIVNKEDNTRSNKTNVKSDDFMNFSCK